MKLFLCVLLMLSVVLCGCQRETKAVLETVEDEIVANGDELLLEVSVFIPQEEEQGALSSTPAEYIGDGGNYRIQTCRILASSAESALRQLTHGAPVTVLQTSRFQMPEYRFSWTKQGEELLCCRGRMVQDGDVFYAVLFSAKESVGNQYDSLMTQVFSSFGLYFDEDV